MALPGYAFHPLKGDRKNTYSVSVSGNWRITFKFINGDVADVDLKDYHESKAYETPNENQPILAPFCDKTCCLH